MTSIMDSGDSLIDPQTEVKKLQDLVKKLERQNEVLRGKQKLSNDPTLTADNFKETPTSNNAFNRKHSESEDSIESEKDLIDVDRSLTDKEDSWLYSSPKPPTPLQTRVSPYKWVRQDLDNPSPEIENAKKSLKSKLEEVARISRSSSTPAFSNYSTPVRGSQANMSQSADSTPSPQYQKPMIRQSLVASKQGSRIDTGTFTRPKKNREPAAVGNQRSEEARERETQAQKNVTDIENLARAQEESLRQSLAQTSPRRGFKPRPLPNVTAVLSSDTDNSASPGGSNRSSPGRFDVEGMNRRNSQSNNSVGSDHSSPPDSPFGSNQYLDPPSNDPANLRRSLPNVSRLTHNSMLHASDTSLDHHGNNLDYGDSPDPRHLRLQANQKRPLSPNISGLKQPSRIQRGLSPQRSGLPTPNTRRTIPRPGSAGRGGIPTPRRSGIPSPRLTGSSPHLDDSWKEGCF